MYTKLMIPIYRREGISSWTFELDFRVGLSSWPFELDFRVGLSGLNSFIMS